MEENSLVARSGIQPKGLRKASKKLVAACYRQTDLFYGNYSDLREEPQEEKLIREWQAKSVCRECELIKPCRTFALQSGEEYGVWGGLTPGERREFLRWLKSFYGHVELTDEDFIEELVERWTNRWRKKQTKKETDLPRHYARVRFITNPNRRSRGPRPESN